MCIKWCLMFNEKIIDNLINQNIIQDNIRRKQVAIENGLDENATWTDIANFHSEKQRKELIKKFNLKEDATWRDISEYYSNTERITAAYNKRLPETASWEEINGKNLIDKSSADKS